MTKITRKLQDEDLDTHSSDSDKETPKPLFWSRGPPSYKPMFQPKKAVKQVEVKLEDHPDKYEKTIYTSSNRQERNVAVEAKSYEQYRCLLCIGYRTFHTSSPKLMEEHLDEHLNARFTCKDCWATFELQGHLLDHRNKEHSVTCAICGKKFTSAICLKKHLGQKHGEQPYKCYHCKQPFASNPEYKQHILDAHPDLVYKCEKCGRVLRKNSYGAKFHVGSKACLRLQKGNTRISTQCEICGKMVSENVISKHKRLVHQKLRTFKCDICSYTGYSHRALRYHQMTHTGEHPVKCELCDFSCIMPYQLKCHMRTHLKIKPYKCTQCSYAVSWNVQLKDHMQAHFSPTRVDCTECNIAYKNERGLYLHRRKEHGEGEKNDSNTTDEKRTGTKPGRLTRVTKEGEIIKSKTKRRKTKKTLCVESDEDFFELQESENKSGRRKSTRLRATKKLNPEYMANDTEDSEKERSVAHKSTTTSSPESVFEDQLANKLDFEPCLSYIP